LPESARATKYLTDPRELHHLRAPSWTVAGLIPAAAAEPRTMIATRGLPPGRVTLALVADQNSTNRPVILPSMRHRIGFDGCLFGRTTILCFPRQHIGDGPAIATSQQCEAGSAPVWTYNVYNMYNWGQNMPLRPRLHFIPAKAQRSVVRRPLHSAAEDDRGNGTVALLREPCKHPFGPAMILFQTSPCLSGWKEQGPTRES
jgi:hypothetical protein